MTKIAISKIRKSRNSKSYVQREITITQFLLEAPNIDVNPEWQRPDIDRSIIALDGRKTKAQGIIESILSGRDIGEIKLCCYKGRKSSVDGGNRKRAIIGFSRNAFPLHESSPWGPVRYRDLSKEDQTWFNNYTIRIVEYIELSSSDIGELFRDTNNTTPVNHQEMLNSYGMNAASVLVRRLVRSIDDTNDIPHSFFNYYLQDTDDVKKYKYLNFDNNRLAIEEIVARILHRMLQNETPGLSINRDLKDMYVKHENESEELKVAKKKLIAFFDFAESFIVRFISQNKKKLSKNDLSMLVRFYLYMQNKYGKNWKVSNWKDFAREFSNAMHLCRTKENVRVVMGSSKERFRSEAFNKFLSFDTPSINKYNMTIQWFLQEFDMEKASIVFTDSIRCFSKEQIREQWMSQGRKDWVDDRELPFEEACGAHLVPWSKGGSTKRDNLVVTSFRHNIAMGAMNAETYKNQVLGLGSIDD